MTKLTLFLATLLTAVNLQAQELIHTLPAPPYPWTNKPPVYEAGAVRFAVFGDLTGSEREGVFKTAIAQLNLLRPELVINVGDLIQSGGSIKQLNEKWEAFDQRANQSSAPVIYMGGNHDLLADNERQVWADRLGPRYFHLQYRDILFLVLDTEDYTPERRQQIIDMKADAYDLVKEQGWDVLAETDYGKHPEDETGAISVAQSEYMLNALAEHDDVRWTFVLTHKAPWANEDMSTWQAIEAALADRPYTVFNGHRHAYKHTVRQGRDYIRLATTGGVMLPQNGPAYDHMLWVTVDSEGAHVASLKMSGILDKEGLIPTDGESLCLEAPCTE